ncbi:MAG TPA: EamA family transporter [Planctomycetota bacterium]|nr:EamA family transporter [Planctomycetota bacterium]
MASVAPDLRERELHRFTVPLLVALLCLVWGSTWWAIRLCLQDHPPLSSAALRFCIAGLVMTALAPRLARLEAAPPPPRWLWITSGLLNFAGSYGVLYAAETVVPSGIAAVLWSIFPLLMACSAVLFLGERLRARQLAGFVVSFLGILTVFSGALESIGQQSLGWLLLVLASPVVSATGTTLVKKYGSGTSSVLLNRNGMVFGAVLLGAAAFRREDPLAMAWTWQATVATLYLALFGTALTFGIYFWLLRRAPASMLSLISYVTPVLAMLIAAAVGDGETNAGLWLGTGLVVTGVALVVARAKP